MANTYYFLFCNEETSRLWDEPEEGKTPVEMLLENEDAEYNIYKWDKDYDDPADLLFMNSGWCDYFVLTKTEYNQLSA